MNRLVADGVVKGYAIGGAIGASFYMRAMQTEDLDIFVSLKDAPSGLVSLAPIYDALRAQGGRIEAGHVRFGEWAVQILTDANALVTEAIRKAKSVTFDGVPTRVCTAEHLCAIALQVGRSKDLLRVALFLEQQAVDRKALKELLARYHLTQQLARVEALGRGGSERE